MFDKAWKLTAGTMAPSPTVPEEKGLGVSEAWDEPQPVEAQSASEAAPEVEPVYETLPGWREDISKCRRFEELPGNAQQYVKRLESLVGAPIRMVSVGAERSATLMR